MCELYVLLLLVELSSSSVFIWYFNWNHW